MTHTALAAAALCLLAACSPQPGPTAISRYDSTLPAEAARAASPTRQDDMYHLLLGEYPDAGTIRYAAAWADLDGDGVDEAVVHLVGPYFCGSGGCNTLILQRAGAMWTKIAEISISRLPITVMDTSTDGWRDLTVAVGGGGGRAGHALLRYDGEGYPVNPTVAPATPTEAVGTVLIGKNAKLTEAIPVAGSGG